MNGTFVKWITTPDERGSTACFVASHLGAERTYELGPTCRFMSGEIDCLWGAIVAGSKLFISGKPVTLLQVVSHF